MALPLLALPLIAKVGAATQIGKSAVKGIFGIAKFALKTVWKGTKLLAKGIRGVTRISRKALKKVGRRVKSNMLLSPGLREITRKKPSFAARLIGSVNAGKVGSQSSVMGAASGTTVIHNHYYNTPLPQVQHPQPQQSPVQHPVSQTIEPAQLERVNVFSGDKSRSVESPVREKISTVETLKIQLGREKDSETLKHDNKHEVKTSRRNSSKRSKRKQE